MIHEGADYHFSRTLCKPELPTPEYVLSINESFERKRRTVKLKDAIGQVSGSIYSPCPPGCVVIDIGEEI